MFYRIKDNDIYDYADYEYAIDCLCTELCTREDFEKNRDIYIISDGKIEQVQNPEEVIAQRRKAEFEKEFFQTSLGWIRRKVTMKDGTRKDFLSDILLSIKAGTDLGQEVKIIVYQLPDYTKELTKEYVESLQEIKSVTQNFISECLQQTVKDFGNL